MPFKYYILAVILHLVQYHAQHCIAALAVAGLLSGLQQLVQRAEGFAREYFIVSELEHEMDK